MDVLGHVVARAARAAFLANAFVVVVHGVAHEVGAHLPANVSFGVHQVPLGESQTKDV